MNIEGGASLCSQGENMYKEILSTTMLMGFIFSTNGCAVDAEEFDGENLRIVEQPQLSIWKKKPKKPKKPTPPKVDWCDARSGDTWDGAPYYNSEGQRCVATYREECARDSNGACFCMDFLVSENCTTLDEDGGPGPTETLPG